MTARAPEGDVDPPSVVARIAAGRPMRAVWENEIGGVTFELGRDPDRQFVKWVPSHESWRLEAEEARLRWSVAHTPVPEVLDAGHHSRGAWLVTRGLPGDSAVSPRWMADPASAVRAIGAGLRGFHDALPVAACPFGWSSRDRVAEARQRARQGLLVPARWDEDHQHLSIEQ